VNPSTVFVLWVSCGVLGAADTWITLSQGKYEEDREARTMLAIMREENPAMLASIFAMTAITAGLLLLLARAAIRADRWLKSRKT
jgi:hypothetical protein